MNKFFRKKLLEKGRKKFEEILNYSDTPFVDLVHQNDIVYSKSLAKLLKGREIDDKNIQEMHNKRLKDLTISLKQKVIKERKLKSLSDINEELYAGRLKTMRLGSIDITFEEHSEFLTLSSYDHKVTILIF